MPRRHKEDLEYVWRAVVTRAYANGRTYSTYHGIFNAKGHASNAANHEASHYSDAVISIQRSKLHWEELETR